MNKLAIIIAMGLLAACQNNKKTDDALDSATQKVTAMQDSLTFRYDSVKVYSKNPVSADKRVTDTAKAVISYPVFSDAQTNKFVQEKVMKTAGPEKSDTSYKDYASSFIKEFDDFQRSNKDRIQTWFLDIRTTVLEQSADYLAMQARYVNYSGGAHPNTVFIYLNYDPVNHKEITLNSLIQPGSMPKLTAIAEKIFRKNEKLSDTSSLKGNYFFENDVFKLPDNFTITKEGLKFLYNPYEIKAYVYGTTELVVPFTAIKAILKESILTNADR